jgi:hypothetical protein
MLRGLRAAVAQIAAEHQLKVKSVEAVQTLGPDHPHHPRRTSAGFKRGAQKIH